MADAGDILNNDELFGDVVDIQKKVLSSIKTRMFKECHRRE